MILATPGLPGETVYINDAGEIYINGTLLKENYGLETIQNPGLASEPITTSPKYYWCWMTMILLNG